jgi:2-amino-4-hydroxy-6-hydroxymethyldihydropteridine diphosphokinase
MPQSPSLRHAAEHACVALGSNLGDSPRIVREAMDRLGVFSRGPLLKSSLWRSSPVDCPPGSPDYINAVVGLTPLNGETPESLLAKLLALELGFGPRPRALPNQPRRLDLDLIAFGSEIRSAPDLTLPHPRAQLRRFVLEPLAEIAPDLVLPGQTRDVRSLLNALESSAGRIERVAGATE